MGNHAHLVLEDTDAELSTFAQYFFGQAAKAINQLDRVHGAVLEKRFAEIVIVDRAALLKRIAYAICNPVEAGLVSSYRDWNGLCFFSSRDPEVHRFEIFHEQQYQRALKCAELTGVPVDRNEFIDSADLEMAPIEDELANEVDAAIKAREAELHSKQPGVVGMKRVLKNSPFGRPTESKRLPMPLCFASTREAFRAFSDGWYTFVAAFRQASAAFRAGSLTAVFPLFSFRPCTAAA
jgi:hypothetical protein